jgi:hypothetical protein
MEWLLLGKRLHAVGNHGRSGAVVSLAVGSALDIRPAA